jgi:glycosyltransferase involved in cell wall biosynthesis
MNQPSFSSLVPVVLVCNDEYWLPYSLEASRGWFTRYIIYDVGSTDRTRDIIDWFIKSNPDAEFYVRYLNHIPHPEIQGIFRNSMIAEARSDWYLILDADEVYTDRSFASMHTRMQKLQAQYEDSGVIYGVASRIEIAANLKHAYGQDRSTPHHRLYHRTAIWTGPHPGEVALYKQEPKKEHWDRTTVCYHFHNPERSTKDADVPKRLERRSRGTYRPGEATDFNLLKELPLLRERIEDFPVNPLLEELQREYA